MNTNAQAARPLPDTEDALSKPFWDAAKNKRLVMHRCLACGAYRYPPELGCYECGSQDSEWSSVSGEATLDSWTVLYPPVLPFFKDKTPFPVAIVKLKEGPRMTTNLVDIPIAEYKMGMPLKVCFEDQPGEDCTLVFFKRA